MSHSITTLLLERRARSTFSLGARDARSQTPLEASSECQDYMPLSYRSHFCFKKNRGNYRQGGSEAGSAPSGWGHIWRQVWWWWTSFPSGGLSIDLSHEISTRVVVGENSCPRHKLMGDWACGISSPSHQEGPVDDVQLKQLDVWWESWMRRLLSEPGCSVCEVFKLEFLSMFNKINLGVEALTRPL